jgi:hypothetical protein
MSFTRTIISSVPDQSGRQKAKEVNERRRQAQAFLRRDKDQKKQPAKDAPCPTQT